MIKHLEIHYTHPRLLGGEHVLRQEFLITGRGLKCKCGQLLYAARQTAYYGDSYKGTHSPLHSVCLACLRVNLSTFTVSFTQTERMKIKQSVKDSLKPIKTRLMLTGD